MLPAVELQDRQADRFIEVVADGVAEQPTEHRCDSGDSRVPPRLLPVAEHHRYQHDVRRDGEERAFDEGDEGERPWSAAARMPCPSSSRTCVASCGVITRRLAGSWQAIALRSCGVVKLRARRRTISLRMKRPLPVARMRCVPGMASIRPCCVSAAMAVGEGRTPLRRVNRSRSTPSERRKPMSSISSASSAAVSGVSSMIPWPSCSTRAAQASGLRSVLVACRTPPASQAPVCARTAAGVFAVAPVEQVVAALLARRGVVGDLVGWQARRGRQLLRRIVERQRCLLVGNDELAGGVQRCERRLRLDGELIERQMLAGDGECIAQLVLPRGERLPGPRVDEIEREAIERRARDLDRRLGLGDRMNAAERFQDVVAQRLHAERHAIDARRAIAAEARRLDAAGIGFERDLGIRLDAPQRSDLIEDRGDRLRLPSAMACRRRRRCSKRSRGPVRARSVHQLAQEGGAKARLVNAAETDVAVEVAVGALLGAERPVHVDAEAHLVGACLVSRAHRGRPA